MMAASGPRTEPGSAAANSDELVENKAGNATPTQRGSKTSSRPTSTILGLRRSMDLASWSNLHTRSGSHGTLTTPSKTTASNSPSPAASRFGIVAGLPATSTLPVQAMSGSAAGATTLASNKRSRGGLIGLFNGSATTDHASEGQTPASMADDEASASGGHAEQALFSAVQGSEHAAWQFAVTTGDRDSLLLGANVSSAISSSTLSPFAKASRMLKNARRSKDRDVSAGHAPTPTNAASATKRSLAVPEASVSRPLTRSSSPTFTQGQLLVVYVRTGTSSLTLYRSLSQLVKLDSELRTQFGDKVPAHRPAVFDGLPVSQLPSPSNSTSGHQRRRSVLAALRTTLGASPRPRQEHSTDQRVPTPDGKAPGTDIAANPEVVAPKESLAEVASYLSVLSNNIVIRTSAPWKRFFAPSKEDHVSQRLEERNNLDVRGSPASNDSDSDAKRVKKMRSEADISGTSSTMDGIHSIALNQLTRKDEIAQDAAHNLRASTNTPVGDPDILALIQRMSEEADAQPKDASQDRQPVRAEPVQSAESYAAIQVDEEKQTEQESHSRLNTEPEPLAPIDLEPREDIPIPLPTGGSVSSEMTQEEANAALTLFAEAHSHVPVPEVERSAVNTPDLLDTEDRDIVGDLVSRKSSVSSVDTRIRTASSQSGKSSESRRIGIQDFQVLQVLGKGCAGKVLLARYRRSNALYAVKAIYKHHVLAHRELEHTLTEQSILKKMATDSVNPFVVKMSFSFQDKEHLFLVLDFHPGGDLATQLAKWGRLGKDRTRFYAAEIIEGLEGLHAAGVIYRDLKPENILLDADGHVVLTDFGLSKQFRRPIASSPTEVMPQWLREAGANRVSTSSSSPSAHQTLLEADERTLTFCGTAEYLAPEVLLGQPYSYGVDLWSLGTMVYEMLVGVTPFFNEDHGLMYKRVLYEPLNLPDTFLDAETRALLRGLLQKDPEFRMNTKRVKRCKYFEAIDWNYVYNKRYIPPYVPTLGDVPEDTQNFDEAFLNMDTNFVDASDIAEMEEKAGNSGKLPQSPVDEHGRDVFADYSFQGIGLDPEISPVESEPTEEEVVPPSSANAVKDGVSENLKTDEPVYDDSTSQSSSSKHSTEDARDYDTGMTSASVTDDERSKHTKDSSADHLRMDSRVFTISTGGDPPPSVIVEESEEYSQNLHEGDALAAPDTELAPTGRNSVEMPKRSFDMIRDPGQTTTVPVDPARKSHDGEDDWDVLETMDDEEAAINGVPLRRRVLGNATLFARGVVDKYKMQIKPLSRVPTPTRSRTGLSALGFGSRQNSALNLTGPPLSPTTSAAGRSDISLAASPSSIESPKRFKSPRLVRASTEWMSSSLPSPSPKFRFKRSKQGSYHKGSSKNLAPTDFPGRAASPVSMDSSATLPIESAGAPLHALTRQANPQDHLGEA